MTPPDPIEELGAVAEAGAKLANSPDALRARLAELQDGEQEQARAEVRAALAENPEAFHEDLDSGNPEVVAKVKRALGGGV